MHRLKRLALLIVLGATLCLAPASLWSLPVNAQEEACPALVEEALARAGEVCTALGRNQACYGNSLVEARDWQQVALSDFTAPGHLADITQVATLNTAPMRVEEDTWGVAVLSLQANLPETLPGQNVTFIVFGDAELTNAVSPDAVAPPAPMCTGTVLTSTGTNVRSGPGTEYEVIGGLASGEAMTANGRNAAGDWLRLSYRGQNGWVHTPLVELSCDPATLDEVSIDDSLSYTTPMQAFYLKTGFGLPTCQEAPHDGVIIQAPENVTVNFMMNGVGVSLGSTAFFLVNDEDQLLANVMEGAVTLTSAGKSQTARAGQYIAATADTPPTRPAPCTSELVQSLPVELLPRQIWLPWWGTGEDWTEGTPVAVTPAAEGTCVTLCDATHCWEECR